jgi:hypothetical protein
LMLIDRGTTTVAVSLLVIVFNCREKEPNHPHAQHRVLEGDGEETLLIEREESDWKETIDESLGEMKIDREELEPIVVDEVTVIKRQLQKTKKNKFIVLVEEILIHPRRGGGGGGGCRY